MFSLERLFNKQRPESDGPVVELMKHHVRIVKGLARRPGTAQEIAEYRTQYIEEFYPEYRLSNSRFANQF